jgi:hypothetical protein
MSPRNDVTVRTWARLTLTMPYPHVLEQEDIPPEKDVAALLAFF